MFTDPQSVTISGSAKSLVRTGSTESGGRFATADRAHQLSVNHSYGRRTRHQIKLQVDSLTANPLVPDTFVNSSRTYYLVADVPNGFDTATAKAEADGFIANLSASTGANLTKLLGGES